MKVILFNRKELIITKEQYDKLWQTLQQVDDNPWVKINGLPYKKSAIAHFEEGGYTEADASKLRQNDPNRRLQSYNRSDKVQFKSARKAADVARRTLRARGLNV